MYAEPAEPHAKLAAIIWPRARASPLLRHCLVDSAFAADRLELRLQAIGDQFQSSSSSRLHRTQQPAQTAMMRFKRELSSPSSFGFFRVGSVIILDAGAGPGLMSASSISSKFLKAELDSLGSFATADATTGLASLAAAAQGAG